MDAVSVEIGIGPDCRERLLVFTPELEAFRPEANKIVHDIAVRQTGLPVLEAVARLREFGFTALAARVADRVADVVIDEVDGQLAIRAPYEPAAVPAWRALNVGHYDKATKTRYVPRSHARPVLAVLTRFFRGMLAIGPKGPFIIGAAS